MQPKKVQTDYQNMSAGQYNPPNLGRNTTQIQSSGLQG